SRQRSAQLRHRRSHVISASGMVWPLEKVPVLRFWPSTATDCNWPAAKPFCCSWLTCAVPLELAYCAAVVSRNEHLKAFVLAAEPKLLGPRGQSQPSASANKRRHQQHVRRLDHIVRRLGEYRQSDGAQPGQLSADVGRAKRA